MLLCHQHTSTACIAQRSDLRRSTAGWPISLITNVRSTTDHERSGPNDRFIRARPPPATPRPRPPPRARRPSTPTAHGRGQPDQHPDADGPGHHHAARTIDNAGRDDQPSSSSPRCCPSPVRQPGAGQWPAGRCCSPSTAVLAAPPDRGIEADPTDDEGFGTIRLRPRRGLSVSWSWLAGLHAGRVVGPHRLIDRGSRRAGPSASQRPAGPVATNATVTHPRPGSLRRSRRAAGRRVVRTRSSASLVGVT